MQLLAFQSFHGRRLAGPALTALIVAALAPCSVAQTQPPRAIVITHATVVDTKGGPSLRDMTVIVRDGRIASLARGGTPPARAIVVNGQGKYVIPGLCDMHVHLSYSGPSALPLLLAHGITCVRDLGSRLSEIDGWQAQIRAGVLDGPRIFRAGPMLNGRSSNEYQVPVTTPEEARGAVRALKFAGVDFIKTHRRTTRAAYLALIDEAKKVGLDVVGHIPMEVTPEEALSAGQLCVEHVETLFEGTFSADLPEGEVGAAIQRWMDTDAPEALFRRFVENKTYFTPLVVPWASDARSLGPDARDPRLKYIAASRRKTMLTQNLTPEDVETMRRRVARFTEVVRRAHKAGVPLLAGTDTGPTRPPGVLLAEELGYLADARLTPLEVLQTATLTPANVLHKSDELGTVEAGKLADLVVLDADPLADIRSVSRIDAVIANGRLYRRADLDRLLKDGERVAAQN